MKWISVKDRLPEILSENYFQSSVVLVYESEEIRFGWCFESGNWSVMGRLGNINVTHWMPLPEPPKED